MLLLMLKGGLRPGEVLCLHLEHVQLDGQKTAALMAIIGSHDRRQHHNSAVHAPHRGGCTRLSPLVSRTRYTVCRAMPAAAATGPIIPTMRNDSRNRAVGINGAPGCSRVPPRDGFSRTACL